MLNCGCCPAVSTRSQQSGFCFPLSTLFSLNSQASVSRPQLYFLSASRILFSALNFIFSQQPAFWGAGGRGGHNAMLLHRVACVPSPVRSGFVSVGSEIKISCQYNACWLLIGAELKLLAPTVRGDFSCKAGLNSLPVQYVVAFHGKAALNSLPVWYVVTSYGKAP